MDKKTLLQCLLQKLSRNEAPFLSPFAKQWISKDIPSHGSQSKRAKIAIHWFGNNLVPRVSLLCLHCRWEKTLVDSGHLSPRIWEVHQMCVRGWIGNVGLVDIAKKGISTQLILWPDDHRQNVWRQYLWTTHMEFDVKGKKLWSNRSDATENNLALFAESKYNENTTLVGKCLSTSATWPESTRVFSQWQWKKRRETLGTR